MKPVVDGLKKDYEGKVDFNLINTDKATAEQNQLANQLGITVVPTFVFMNKDGSVAKKVVGEQKAAALKAELDALK